VRQSTVRLVRSFGYRTEVFGGPRGAAAQLGLKRTTLQARMKKLGIAQQRPAA